MALGWDTAPGCIQHGVPGSDGVYKSYEKCADFFTMGPGSTFGTTDRRRERDVLGPDHHRDPRHGCRVRRVGGDGGSKAQTAGGPAARLRASRPGRDQGSRRASTGAWRPRGHLGEEIDVDETTGLATGEAGCLRPVAAP